MENDEINKISNDISSDSDDTDSDTSTSDTTSEEEKEKKVEIKEEKRTQHKKRSKSRSRSRSRHKHRRRHHHRHRSPKHHKSSRHRSRSRSHSKRRRRHKHRSSHKRRSRSRSRRRRSRTPISRPLPKEVPSTTIQATTLSHPIAQIPQIPVNLRQNQPFSTSVEIPSYYNKNVINPLIYAEQERKRKLLWSKTKSNNDNNTGASIATNVTSTAIVGKAILESSKDEKTALKMKKLMGIRDDDSKIDNLNKNEQKLNDLNRMQEKTFNDLDKEYEFARMATHTHRGMGLGFIKQYQSSSTTQQQQQQQEN